ncbi:MAG: hypothetical protein WAM14_12005 [Candidatus Nitrosopolaris sp.]
MNNAHSELIDVTNFTETSEEINSCRECGHNDSFRPSFDDVRTSIDIIPLLIQKLQEREQEEAIA